MKIFILRELFKLLSIFTTSFIIGGVVYYTTKEKVNNEHKIQLPSKIVSIYDGDTLTVEFKIRANIRLLDCYAPELKGSEKKEGLKSKEHLESLLKAGDDVMIEIPVGDNISDSISLSRILGKVKKDINGDGLLDDISEQMVESGHATKQK